MADGPIANARTYRQQTKSAKTAGIPIIVPDSPARQMPVSVAAQVGRVYPGRCGRALSRLLVRDRAVSRKRRSAARFRNGGPRERIYFDPAGLRCGIVTCGGLCPGLNDVIRAIVLSLHFHYDVKTIYGFRYGYEGLIPRYNHRALELTPESVDHIGDLGGTILGSSRGPQSVPRWSTSSSGWGWHSVCDRRRRHIARGGRDCGGGPTAGRGSGGDRHSQNDR